MKWKFPFHLNGFFDTKLVLGFVGSGKAFYWSFDSRWEPPRHGAASHYVLQTGEVLFKRKMRKKRLYWPMNGRFIYVNNFQKWLTMLTDLKRVHAAQDKIEQSEILCSLFLVRKPHNCLIQEVHPLPTARFFMISILSWGNTLRHPRGVSLWFALNRSKLSEY